MCTETKEETVLFCINSSYLPDDVKQELINYVKSHNDASIRAAFRLGQMDMRESAAAAIIDTASEWDGRCRVYTMAAMVEHLEVI